ncbi:hypothetical protein FHG87_006718 [Trinorchestia longiramus]|nr:hypothetical protein FHG87_006718 [Trinorchestia longiramus]
MADTTSESNDEARIPLRAEVLRQPTREQDNGSECSDDARLRYDRKHDINTLTPKWYVCVLLRLGSVIFSDPSSDYAYKVKFYTNQAIGGNVLTNERSRSNSRAQPTAQYKEAATLCVTELPTRTNPMDRPPSLNTCAQSANFYSSPSIPFRFTPILRHTLCQTLPQIFPTGTDLPTYLPVSRTLPITSKVNISTRTLVT